MPKFQESITNEEVNGLPVGAFSGEIVVVDTPAAFEEACAYLATQPLIGFDTETRPSFSKGVTNKVSLLQLSSGERAFLFRLNKIALEKPLLRLMESPSVTKIGAAIRDDPEGSPKTPPFHAEGLYRPAKHRRTIRHHRPEPKKNGSHHPANQSIESSAPEQLGSGEPHSSPTALRCHGRLGQPRDLCPANPVTRYTLTIHNPSPVTDSVSTLPTPQTPSTPTARLILKRGKEESLMRFHPWVFSGAIYRMEGSPAEGDLVDVYTSERQFIARGHYQIGSITVRILSFAEEAIDQRWWNARIRAAYRMREALGLAENPQTTCYRLVHGEGDSLPGLVVDIYGRTAVIQCHSVGMYRSARRSAKRSGKCSATG